MPTTKIYLDREYRIARVDPRIFGGFLEHVGRAVYEGVYDPTSPHADKHGYRTDVLEPLRRLKFTAMRYPGGNFASGYHWLDGTGPKADRPKVYEPASQSMEPNEFGTDEFMQLASMMDWQPMMTVNLGSGTPEEARNWLEYCNRPTGTKYADLRARNGRSEPYGAKLWCLGNEMDGPWQIGHVPADQYAAAAQQTAKVMKYVDPSIELVACGSCEVGLPTYMDWDRTVLETLGDEADYVSVHLYVGNFKGNSSDYLAVTNQIDQRIEQMDALCRVVQAKRHSKKRALLAFDEWNVWYRLPPESVNGHGKAAQHLVEEEYNLEDSLVVAGFLNSFIRHADVIKIANLAQIVNVLAPILTRGDELLLQSIYYPLLLYANRREGDAMQLKVAGPGYESPTYGFVNTVDSSAILGNNQLHLFLTNRNLDQAEMVEFIPNGLRLTGIQSAEIVSGRSVEARNTFEQPLVIQCKPFDQIRLEEGKSIIELPPLSAAAITFETNG